MNKSDHFGWSSDHPIEPNLQVSLCDLHYWERVLIDMFRLWIGKGPTKAVAEHGIAVVMEGAPIYPLLDRLFQLFAELSRLAGGRGENGPAEHLSHTELWLLDLASGNFAAANVSPIRGTGTNRSDLSLCAALAQAGIFIRSIRNIPSTEDERLEAAIARSYQTIFRME